MPSRVAGLAGGSNEERSPPVTAATPSGDDGLDRMSATGRIVALGAARSIPTMHVVPWLALAMIGVAVLVPAFAHAIDVWSKTEEFGFGFLILPIVALLVWWRRSAFVGPAQGSTFGLGIVIPALVVYVIGTRVGVHAVAGLAVIPILWGAVLYLRGPRAARILAFPIAYLAFGLGLYRGLLDSLGFALQGITADLAAIGSRAIGLDVHQSGVVLTSGSFAFVVSQPCSGMSSLVSLLALAALWVYVAGGSALARSAVVLAVLPVVLLANGVRVTLVLAVASMFGVDAAVGFFHGASSFVLFAVAVAGLLVVGRAVGCRAPTFAR
jgi:exosortase